MLFRLPIRFEVSCALGEPSRMRGGGDPVLGTGLRDGGLPRWSSGMDGLRSAVACESGRAEPTPGSMLPEAVRPDVSEVGIFSKHAGPRSMETYAGVPLATFVFPVFSSAGLSR